MQSRETTSPRRAKVAARRDERSDAVHKGVQHVAPAGSGSPGLHDRQELSLKNAQAEPLGGAVYVDPDHVAEGIEVDHKTGRYLLEVRTDRPRVQVDVRRIGLRVVVQLRPSLPGSDRSLTR